ncbi:MAG: hypothetical protein Q9221_007109 [Calogaya cf. arnoldii]
MYLASLQEDPGWYKPLPPKHSSFLWNLNYLTSPLPRALHVAYLVVYFLTGSFGFDLHMYYFHTPLLQTPLPPWQYHLQSINLSMEAVLIGVLYLKQRTDILTPRLQEDWKRWYDGDQQEINRMQQKNNCCGFGDIKDIVFPPIQGPEAYSTSEKQKIIEKHTAAARQLYAVCGELDVPTLILCAGNYDHIPNSKVMLLIHLHCKKATSTTTTADVPARPGDEMEAQGKDDDGSLATTMVDRGTLVLGRDDEVGTANSQELSSRNGFVAQGDQE